MEDGGRRQGANWRDLARAASRADPESGNGGKDHTSNVLLQITMPIVLILALIIFTRMKYLEDFRRQVSERPGWEWYEDAYLELQKQVLVAKLEEVKSERISYLGANLFVNAPVRTKSGALDDEHFLNTCQKAYNLYASEGSRDRESGSLYEDVLSRAHKELKEMAAKKGFRYREISQENRVFVRKEIEAFTEANINTVIELQLKTISIINAYFRANPRALQDERLAELMLKYASEPESEQPELAAEIYDRLRRRLKSDLESTGYSFLPEAWQRVRI